MKLNKDYKISIVMPVYNAEQFIQNSIKQIGELNDNNFELIVVNDGSSDNSKIILETLEKENSFIKVFNTTNQGVSEARNLGIKNAKGEYILFLDADDCLEPNTLKELRANLNNEDIIIFGFKVEGDSRRKNDTNILQELEKNSYNKNDIVLKILKVNDNIFGYAWRAIYNKNFLEKNNIEFPKKIKISEDYQFFLNSVLKSEKLKIYPKELYIYEINSSSMSIKFIPSLLNDMMEVNKWVYNNIDISNYEFLNKYYCTVANTYLRFVQNSMKEQNTSFFRKIDNIYKEKKKYNFSFYIKKALNEKKELNKKFFISMILFKYNLEILYAFLFTLKYKLRILREGK